MTKTGLNILTMALNGSAPRTRFGSEIESSYDTRLSTSEEFANTIKLLGQKYANAIEDEPKAKPGKVLSFDMHYAGRRSKAAQQQLSLAASTSSKGQADYWTVQIPGKATVEARIDHTFLTDELFFLVEDVRSEGVDLKATASIVAWFNEQESPISSEQFELAPKTKVFLARDLGRFPNELRRLELRLVNER